MISAPEIAQTFALEYPFTFKGVDYAQIGARRPKVKDLRVLSKGDDRDPVGSYNAFLQQIFTLPNGVVDELDLVDYKAIQDWVKDFLPKSDEQTS